MFQFWSEFYMYFLVHRKSYCYILIFVFPAFWLNSCIHSFHFRYPQKCILMFQYVTFISLDFRIFLGLYPLGIQRQMYHNSVFVEYCICNTKGNGLKCFVGILYLEYKGSVPKWNISKMVHSEYKGICTQLVHS